MSLTRRKFLTSSMAAGAGLATSRLVQADVAPASRLLAAAASDKALVVPAPTGEWMASSPASAFRAYRSKPAQNANSLTWVQIDLGKSLPIDSVKIYPANDRGYPDRDEYYAGAGFPVRFKIESSQEPAFRSPTLIADYTSTDYPNPRGNIVEFVAHGVTARYVRLTATRLMDVVQGGFGDGRGGYFLSMSKIDVYSGGREVAELCPVTADPTYGFDDDLAQLTRAPRSGGETTFVDHPENVTPASSWQPPMHKVRVPRQGVQLEGGTFHTAMENNARYLLNSYSADDLLRQFRERAGVAKPLGKLTGDQQFWEEDLAGSNAGRFLMGAGNTLRWIENPELRRRLNEVVDGIEQYRQPNGYIMAYPEETIFYSERGAYTRAWLVHGLIEAGYSGNSKAFDLLRGYSDCFNRCPYLPQLQRFAVQGGQGMVANTRMYFTPVGKAADIQVIQRYFQENFWMEQLAARETQAIWQYPYDRPHCYLLTNLEAYMDLFLGTGDPRYFRAVEGAWELYHENWENSGGTISIIEFLVTPPSSNQLHSALGELCGNSFWTFLSQRFHLLDPENERYVAEIEKSIYNVALANQRGSDGFRYHALLVHQKEEPTRKNTCCEGQGTRLIGSLPEHIYSLASDGVYVNLFEPSTVHWTEGEAALHLKMVTRFPFDPKVRLQFSAAKPVQAKIRIRVPSWANNAMSVSINNKTCTVGKPGTYVVVDRAWMEGDAATFTLPIGLRAERYGGVDQIPGYARYSVSIGPVLLAAVGAPEVRLRLQNAKSAEDLLKWLRPKPGAPLHYLVQNNPGVEFMPYWQVNSEPFNCFPAVPV